MRFALLACFLMSSASAVLANDAAPAAILKAEGYVQPGSTIYETVTAPWHLNVTGGAMSPDRSRMLITVSDGMPKLANLAKSYVRLAGFAVDLEAERSRTLTMRNNAGYDVMDVKTGERASVVLPDGLRVTGASWSPDGSKIAMIGMTDKETHLYVADAKGLRARRVGPALKLTGTSGFDWLADSSRVAVVIRPDASAMPARSAISPMPWVRNTTRAQEGLRTYASLLQTPTDGDQFEDLMLGQLALVNLDNGSVQKVGAPQMYTSVASASDGSAFLVSATSRPFNYIQPYSTFPSKTYYMAPEGKEIHVVSRRGGASASDEVDLSFLLFDDEGNWIDDEQRRGGQGAAGGSGSGAQTVGNGMRSLGFAPDGKGLTFLQLEPMNREDRDAPRKDRLMRWMPPYRDEDKSEIYSTETRINSVQFSDDFGSLFLSQTVDGKSVVNMVKLSDPGTVVKVLENPTGDDAFYSNPGSLVTVSSPFGGRVVMVGSDGAVFLSGTKYDKNPAENAPRAFVTKVALPSGEKTTVFESAADKVESASPLDDDFGTMLVDRESPTEVPQMFYVERGSGVDRQITKNIDYAPSLTQARDRVVRVKRADGFEFDVTVTLPRYSVTGHDKPAMFWFYPSEVVDQATYDRGKRSFNKNRFTRVSSSTTRHLLNEGYVVVNNDCPIVGPSEAPNDQFRHQLIMNLSATIDALSKERLIDRERLAIGGHSYGGFGTANALIHTPFFKAGIAGAGNYNRTLTPYGFQREPRKLWQMREVYSEVSALLHADKLTGALLMYHGMDDQNVGTNPQHSKNMFHALESLGKTASLYMYPFEDHGQIAEETRLDMWARWVAWLDIHVKNPGSAKEEESEAPARDSDGDGDGSPVVHARF